MKNRIALLILGPVGIVPLGLVTALLIGGWYYVPPEVTGQLETSLFLQGSTDLGGGCLFAGTIALYVVFGFTTSIYLVETLPRIAGGKSFVTVLLPGLILLSVHIAFFWWGGRAHFSYDERVKPNDFRNLFWCMALLYTLTWFWIAILVRYISSRRFRIILAPAFIFLWLIIGSDGNTWRAGQLVQSGQNPQRIVRGFRHGLMMWWHDACDLYFDGEVFSDSTV